MIRDESTRVGRGLLEEIYTLLAKSLHLLDIVVNDLVPAVEEVGCLLFALFEQIAGEVANRGADVRDTFHRLLAKILSLFVEAVEWLNYDRRKFWIVRAFASPQFSRDGEGIDFLRTVKWSTISSSRERIAHTPIQKIEIQSNLCLISLTLNIKIIYGSSRWWSMTVVNGGEQFNTRFFWKDTKLLNYRTLRSWRLIWHGICWLKDVQCRWENAYVHQCDACESILFMKNTYVPRDSEIIWMRV